MNQFSLARPDHGVPQPRAGALSNFSGSGEEPKRPVLPAVHPTHSEDTGASVGAEPSPTAEASLPCASRRHPPCGTNRGDAHHPATSDPADQNKSPPEKQGGHTA